MEKNFLTPFIEILGGLANLGKGFSENPGYYLGLGVIALAAFCAVVLTGGDGD